MEERVTKVERKEEMRGTLRGAWILYILGTYVDISFPLDEHQQGVKPKLLDVESLAILWLY